MKKNWIYLKRGILTPEHVNKMGVRFWLYLYMLDVADWPTGTITHWRDRLAADDLGIPEATIRDQRARLAADGYITMKQGYQELHVAIVKWVNPRSYDGEVHNTPRVAGAENSAGEEKSEPSEFHGETHGVTHGDTHGDTATQLSSLNPLTINHKAEEKTDGNARHKAQAAIDTHFKLGLMRDKSLDELYLKAQDALRKGTDFWRDYLREVKTKELMHAGEER